MKKLLATTAILAALAAPAWANDFQADSFSQPSGFQNVTITAPVNLTVRAGEINLHHNGPPSADLLVWCLDLQDLLTTPYDFQLNTFVAGDSRPGIPSGLTAGQIRQIASLMLLGLTVNPDADSDAAVQVAIWKTEYGAGFSDTGVSVSLAAKIALLLLDSANGGLIDCPSCSLTVLTDAVNAPNQALGFAVAVPAPIVGAGLPGIIAGALGLWSFAKRRRNRA